MDGKTSIFRLLRNTLNAELRRNTGLVTDRAKARGVKMVVTSPRYVDEVGRENMGIGQRRLIGLRSLVALLKSTAVRDTAKRAGYQLRVINVTEAEEYLVFLSEIEVDAGVKGVTILNESWIGGKV